MAEGKPLQLFHRIADPASATVRRYVTDHELEDAVQFRNVAYPEVVAALAAHGAAEPPAIWDGERLSVGAQACIARLIAFADVGRRG